MSARGLLQEVRTAFRGLLKARYLTTVIAPCTLAAAAAIFLAMATLASLLPAARAAATDPTETLRVG